MRVISLLGFAVVVVISFCGVFVAMIGDGTWTLIFLAIAILVLIASSIIHLLADIRDRLPEPVSIVNMEEFHSDQSKW